MLGYGWALTTTLQMSTNGHWASEGYVKCIFLYLLLLIFEKIGMFKRHKDPS